MDNSPVKLLDKVRQRIRLRVKDIDFEMNHNDLHSCPQPWGKRS
jgi:hypothetical protein